MKATKATRLLLNLGMSSADAPVLLPLWKARAYHSAVFELRDPLCPDCKDRILQGDLYRSREFRFVRVVTAYKAFIVLTKRLPICYEIPEYLDGKELIDYIDIHSTSMIQSLINARKPS
jgi:hypothetical protein